MAETGTTQDNSEQKHRDKLIGVESPRRGLAKTACFGYTDKPPLKENDFQACTITVGALKAKSPSRMSHSVALE